VILRGANLRLRRSGFERHRSLRTNHALPTFSAPGVSRLPDLLPLFLGKRRPENTECDGVDFTPSGQPTVELVLGARASRDWPRQS
jgi:hypothetical protein